MHADKIRELYPMHTRKCTRPWLGDVDQRVSQSPLKTRAPQAPITITFRMIRNVTASPGRRLAAVRWNATHWVDADQGSYDAGPPSSLRVSVSEFGLYAVAIRPVPPAINATQAGVDGGIGSETDVVAILAGVLGSLGALLVMGTCTWWTKKRKERGEATVGGEGKAGKGTEFGRRFMLVTSDGALPLESSPPPPDNSGGGGWEGGTVFLSPARRHRGFEESQEDAPGHVPVRLALTPLPRPCTARSPGQPSHGHSRHHAVSCPMCHLTRGGAWRLIHSASQVMIDWSFGCFTGYLRTH